MIKHEVTYICDNCQKQELASKEKPKTYITFEICIQQSNEENTMILFQEDYEHHFCSVDCLHEYLIYIIPNYKLKKEQEEIDFCKKLYIQQNK